MKWIKKTIHGVLYYFLVERVLIFLSFFQPLFQCLPFATDTFKEVNSYTLPLLSDSDRNKAIEIFRGNVNVAHIARTFNTIRKTIHLLRLAATGIVKDRRRTGRPKKTTNGRDPYINTLYLRNRFKTARKTARQVPKSHSNKL